MPNVSQCQLLHPERPSGPCAICRESKPRYWHISQASNKHVQLVIDLRQRGISDVDCICQRCQKNPPKNQDDSSNKRRASNICQIPNCSTELDQVHQTSKSFKPETLEMVFGLERSDAIELCTQTSGIFLCHRHYCLLTNRVSRATCTLCDSFCQRWLMFSDVSALQLFAQEQLQKELEIEGNIKLCNICYQAVTRYSKTQYRDTLASSKEGLTSLFESFKSSCDKTEAESSAVLDAMQSLFNQLMDDKVVLLEEVYEIYSSSYSSYTSASSSTMSVPSFKRNPLQLLHYIKAAIGDCIICSSLQNQKRLGTLIRRRGSDILVSLHKLRFQHVREVERFRRELHTLQSSQTPARDNTPYWRMTADNLQEVVVDTAKTYVNQTTASVSFEGISVLKEVEKIPSFLWNFIFLSTLSAVEKKELSSLGPFNWKDHCLTKLHPSDVAHRKKLMRRLFTCLSFLSACNDRCFSPLHIVLSDVVDRFSSSSSTCFQLLSAFGITVSKPTFQRFQTSIAMEEMAKKHSVLANNNFVVASVDNIDRSSSYAAVSAGNADRGFHGTSIQAVEPLSSSVKDLRTNVMMDFGQQQKVDQIAVDKYHQGSSHLPTIPPTVARRSYLLPELTMDSFSISDEEEHAYNQLKHKVFLYMLTKFICTEENLEVLLPDMKSSVCQLYPGEVSDSCVHFTGILAEPADSSETIRHVLDILHEKHDIGTSIDHLVVAGDAKTYEYMLEAKRLYGADLDWLLPYLGEWHLLKNLQAPLMKVYLDAGLRQLLSVLHKGATHTAVAAASGFRKTHNFLLQSWEAMYRHQMALFKSHVSGSADNVSEPFHSLYAAIIARIRDRGSDIFKDFEGELVNSTGVYETFSSFFQTMGQADATSQFWIDFIHRDMFNYVGLFLSVRLRHFNLRNVTVRKLAPIFHALDRPTYLKLVPHHMAAMKQYPTEILEQFHKGGFSVSITGKHGNCVAFDEAHEMLINKEVKMSMTTTGMGSLTRLVHYLPFRARLMKAFKSEVAATKTSTEQSESHAMFKLTEDNIKLYITKLSEAKSLFLPTNDPDYITHIFTGEVADLLVSGDLKSFYTAGESDLNAYINCVVLNNSGRKPPKRNRRNLKTFTAKKKTVYKQKLELKDQKMQIASLRRQIALSRSSNQPVDSLMQFLCLPRAICTSDQFPFKSSKAISSSEFAKRYPHSFCENLGDMASDLNRSTCYIVEGMFLINCPPLRIHRTFGAYASFLYRRWVQHSIQHFKAKEIHVVFDHPQRHGVSPKDIERTRRNSGDDEPSYNTILTETSCPSSKSWSRFLAVRSQKRLLVNFLSMELLRLHSVNSQTDSILITAGGFDGDRIDKAFCSRPLHEILEAVELSSNHEEGDSRVWFHARVTSCTRIVIYSPDRDTFHVGLPLLPQLGDKEVFVHLRAKKSDNLFLNMHSFQTSLMNDLQLQKVGGDNISKIPSFLQVLYVASGCDFTSFFKGNSKKSFLDVFYRDSEFITGFGTSGSLDEFADANWNSGLLSFYRLIGCVYFRKYSTAFAEESPSDLFRRLHCESTSPLSHHISFLDAIREGHFHRVLDETEWMPSATALKLHWQRCCWVLKVWAQACSSSVQVPDLTLHAWCLKDGVISVVWDSEENMRKVDSNQKMLQSGCKCKTGCVQNRCHCRKENKICTLFCLCKNCQNTAVSSNEAEDISDYSDLSDSSESSQSESESRLAILQLDNDSFFESDVEEELL